jgi:hypothetical protein
LINEFRILKKELIAGENILRCLAIVTNFFKEKLNLVRRQQTMIGNPSLDALIEYLL